MSLKAYRTKRDLSKSKEPAAKKQARSHGELLFVIQKHAARQLHYDLRLEVGGVLKSWAIPKGPSLNPKDKRLAIMVEDHPYDYKDFEGIIPEGYGKGEVIIWDKGTYDVKEAPAKESEKLMKQGIKKGEFHFTLHGKKLRGEFVLIKLKNRERNEWLLIKKEDSGASTGDITKKQASVVSGKKIGKPKRRSRSS